MSSTRPAEALPARTALANLGLVLRAPRTRRLLLSKLRHDRLLMRASSLAYDSLLALVPLLAVSMSSVGVFGGQESLARLFRALAHFYVPSSAGEAIERLIEMVEGLDFHAVGALGLVALLPVVWALVSAVEHTLADVFGMPRRTHWWRLWLVASMLSLAPLGAMWSARYVPLRALPLSQWLVPIGLLSALLYVLFRRMPRVRIKRRAAALGALSASLILAVAKLAFGVYATLAVSLHALWGAVVFLPLFLVWLLVSWYAVLFAATAAAVLHHELKLQEARRVVPVRARRRRSRLRRRLRARGPLSLPDPSPP